MHLMNQCFSEKKKSMLRITNMIREKMNDTTTIITLIRMMRVLVIARMIMITKRWYQE